MSKKSFKKFKKIKFSPLIKENVDFLKKLRQNARSHSKIRELLNGANGKELLCLVECCLNLLKGHFPVSKSKLKCLKKQAGIVRKIARSRSAKTAKLFLHKGIGQKGDGLPMVPALLASIILPILTETLISKVPSMVDSENK